MSFQVEISSRQEFIHSCNALAALGDPGAEWLNIVPLRGGFSLETAPSQSCIARFCCKEPGLLLRNVSHFALEWIRAHALEYPRESYAQLASIEKLYPLMDKAEKESQFSKVLIAIVRNALPEMLPPVTTPPPSAYLFPPPPLPPLPISWPRDIDLSLDEMALTQTYLEEILYRLSHLPPGSFACRPYHRSAKIFLFSSNQVIKEFPFPPEMKIDLFLQSPNPRIIFTTFQILGEGGQRKVKRAYDLLNREELAAKPFCSLHEKALVCESIAQQTRSFSMLVCATHRVFFEKRGRSLYEAHQREPNYFLLHRVSLLSQLLTSLTEIHAMKISDLLRTPGHPGHLYHGDIKPENIMLFPPANASEGGEEIARFTDFGALLYEEGPIATPFYRSPELLRLKKEIKNFPATEKKERCMQFYKESAQQQDLWAFGLFFLSVISNWSVKQGVPPSFIDLRFGIPNLRCLAGTSDEHIEHLTQEELNQSLEQFAQECTDIPPRLTSVWEIAKGLLQIDPAMRMSAQKAEAAFRQIIGRN